MTARRPAPPELSSFLEPFRRERRATTSVLRERVLAGFPNAHEVVWNATNAVSLVYTPTKRWQDGVVHIATYGSRVNLGFNNERDPARPAAAVDGHGLAHPSRLVPGLPRASTARHGSMTTSLQRSLTPGSTRMRAISARRSRVSSGPLRRPQARISTPWLPRLASCLRDALHSVEAKAGGVCPCLRHRSTTMPIRVPCARWACDESSTCRVVVGVDRAMAFVTGVAHRYPRDFRIPLATASRLAYTGCTGDGRAGRLDRERELSAWSSAPVAQ